jgi:hypothetical protein
MNYWLSKTYSAPYFSNYLLILLPLLTDCRVAQFADFSVWVGIGVLLPRSIRQVDVDFQTGQSGVKVIKPCRLPRRIDVAGGLVALHRQ